LWFWDIFNTNYRIGHLKGEEAYQYPYRRSRLDDKGIVQVEQGFAVRVRWGDHDVVRILNRDGFRDIRFKGQYPIGYVGYRDDELPVTVELEAFSPFVPLDLENSIYPATILNYRLANVSDRPIEADVVGWLENAVCLETRKTMDGLLQNELVKADQMTILQCQAGPGAGVGEPRTDIVFEDFEGRSYKNWSVEGTAFGKGPRPNHHQQPLGGYEGKGLADSFFNGRDRTVTSVGSDRHTGKLVSRSFSVNRRHIAFLIGGGNHAEKTCLNLVIDGTIVASATGSNSETLGQGVFDVSNYEGKKAYIEIVDSHSGGWGHILVDEIIFTDTGHDISEKYDYG